MKHLLRYLAGTPTHGLLFTPNTHPSIQALQMQIGGQILMIESQQSVIASSLAQILYHGLQRNKSLYHTAPPKQNIGASLLLVPKSVGSCLFSRK